MPADVRKELFYGSKEAKQVFADYFIDVRALAEEIGLMNPIAKRVWKLLGIDGPSRPLPLGAQALRQARGPRR